MSTGKQVSNNKKAVTIGRIGLKQMTCEWTVKTHFNVARAMLPARATLKYSVARLINNAYLRMSRDAI